MTEWTVTLEAAPDQQIRDAILQPLNDHNVSRVGSGNYAPVAVTVRDASGTIAGGLWGYVWHNHLFVEMLALGEAKGQGVARHVMELAEQEARRLGCIGIWLDTFTFQAPWFYPRLGFVEFARLPNYPAGHERIFLIKRLD